MASLTSWALLWFTLLAVVESFVFTPFRQHPPKGRAAPFSFPVGFQGSFLDAAPLFIKLQQHQGSSPQRSSKTEEELLAFVDDLLWMRKGAPQANEYRQKILDDVKIRYQADCKMAKEALAVEREHTTTITPPTLNNTIPFEWIKSGQENYYSLAVQSMKPVLNLTSVNHLRAAADSLWQQEERKTSRFTYQRPGNYEVHVSDLNQESKSIVNDCLIESIYPLIRKMFWNGDDSKSASSSNLCVYDALIIRYNATEAAAAAQSASTTARTTTTTPGAGQPLHRDFGIVSINVMLNSDDDFVGGGTFFENQLLSNAATVTPLKPRGVGHCLAHYSTERHAGSATLEGVRDILVFFVTAEQTPAPPKLIQSALLKQARRTWCSECDIEIDAIVCRIHHQRLALDAIPKDGEAWQYLGTALMEYSDHAADPTMIIGVAKDCFLHAAAMTPCDSRVYNNLALGLQRLQGPPALIEQAFEQAWDILDRSKKAGCCDVEQDLEALSLNYGLYLSNQDRFHDACRILRCTAMKKKEFKEGGRIVEDAFRLYDFCHRKLEHTQPSFSRRMK